MLFDDCAEACTLYGVPGNSIETLQETGTLSPESFTADTE
jgi:hypothetical protein